MKFRDDIDLETTFVVSDTHFGHDNIVPFCHRPPDHESIMIERWAQAVPPGATVLHLGDLAFKGNARFKALIAPHLTGDKKIILGNHDRGRFSFYKQSGFQIIRPFQLLVAQNDDRLDVVRVPRDATNQEARDIAWDLPQDFWFVSFSHYPWGEPDDTEQMGGRDIRVHGHIHNNGYERDGFMPYRLQHLNVSIEQTKYRPVNLANLLSGALLGTLQVTADDVQKGIENTHELEES